MYLSVLKRRLAALVVAAVTIGGSAVSGSALAGDSVKVMDAWARATIPDRPGAVYLTIHNGGGSDDRLVAASTAAAGRAELHTHIMDGDVMKMRQVEAIETPAGGMAKLEPGGDHVMLFDLAEPLKEGDHLMLKLTFEQAGDIEVMAVVQAMGASEMSHGEMSHGEGMSHEGHGKKTEGHTH